MGRSLVINWVEGRPSMSGGVKSNRLIAEAMARRGHKVTISHLPPTPPWPKIWRLRRFAKRLRIHFEPMRFRHHLEHAAVPTNQMPKRRLEPDRVPDADVTIASWWAVWRAISGWPVSKGLKVHYVRGYEVYAAPRELVESAYRIPGPKVVISSWLADIISGYGHIDIVRIPNGVAWSQFDSKPREKASRPTVGMLMSPGRSKDARVGLRALAMVRERIPDLRIIGFGQRPLPRDWEIPPGVEFHHQPEQREIPELYRACDCWLISSNTEGFGMPGIEAAASHCPIVSTKCGGPSDFVRPGENGELVEIGDADGMADAVERILTSDPVAWKRMSAASYAIAREFDWDRSAQKLEEHLYRWLDAQVGGAP